MRIKLNGKEIEVKEGVTVAGLLRARRLSRKTALVELNRRLLGADALYGAPLREGDALEIFSFVSGG